MNRIVPIELEDNAWYILTDRGGEPLLPLNGINGPSVEFMVDLTGPGAIECPEYHSTRHELSVLAKYWLEQRLSTQNIIWLDGCCNSDEVRSMEYAGRQLYRIATALGDEEFERLDCEVETDFRQKVGEEAWKALQECDTVWRTREWNRIYGKMHEALQAESSNAPGAKRASGILSESENREGT